jgi:HSP20 family molecular chaperone IbpA
VTLEKDTLALKARVEALAFEGMQPVLREFAVGDFERAFTISDEVSRDEIEATVTQGVLKLVLPKTKQAAMQKVTVKAG